MGEALPPFLLLKMCVSGGVMGLTWYVTSVLGCVSVVDRDSYGVLDGLASHA